jgi:glycosyltransferase involved in cell wall biosynthesis
VDTATHHAASVAKRKIFMLYPYYWPHYKAGGPVQSLYNLADFFKNDAEFYMVSLEQDLDGGRAGKPIQLNEWNTGPNGEHIYFMAAISPIRLFQLIKRIKPDVLFVNGMFNVKTTVTGILAGRILNITTIISPRGMLQAWALKRNTRVKKIFLWLFKILIPSGSVWHATDDQEKSDILKHFGTTQTVHIASNIPKQVSAPSPVPFPAVDGKIKLVFLSLINPNKNLHLIIEAVNETNSFSLDIYGPIISHPYWEYCQTKILPGSPVTYKGAVPAWEVTAILASYHFMVLPTEGENFGHAIFDALSVGVPVIITKYTPWKEIDESGAGFYMSLEQNSIKGILAAIVTLSAEAHRTQRTKALDYAKKYWESKDYALEYNFLLTSMPRYYKHS